MRTSTYDGLAIAWAVAEHIHDSIGARTLFATHYHELCELSATCVGVGNWSVAAKEIGEEIVFLHRLVRGGASRSYGVAVARLAGVPITCIGKIVHGRKMVLNAYAEAIRERYRFFSYGDAMLIL